MPYHSYLVLIAFAFMFTILVIQSFRLRKAGVDLLGKASIDRLYFFSAKIAFMTCWALFLIKALIPTIGFIYVPEYLSVIAVILLYIGMFFVTVSLVNLGPSLRMGLPKESTKLRTQGLYGISRNPMYLGINLVTIASSLYFPDLINMSFTIYAIIIHHQIIRREEHFLAERFGEEWQIYSGKVKRYV